MSTVFSPVLDGRVQVEAECIHLRRDNGDNACMARADVVRIALEPAAAHSPSRHWLRFHRADASSLAVSSCCHGFDALVAWLAAWPRFRARALAQALQPADEEVRAGASAQPGGTRRRERTLWRRPAVPNFGLPAVAPVASPADVAASLARWQQGLWLEDRQALLPWGSYAQAEAFAGVGRSVVALPNRAYACVRLGILGPTVAGGLRLPELWTCTDAWRLDDPAGPRMHLPVLCWEARIALGLDRLADVRALCAHLDAALQPHDPQPLLSHQGRRRVDLVRHWQLGRVQVQLRCGYQSQAREWGSEARLAFEVAPDLMPFYAHPYVHSLRAGPHLRCLALPGAVLLQADYRQVDNALYTPACLQPLFDTDHGLVIWVDEAEQVLGFAGPQLALRFDLRACSGLSLWVQNYRGNEGHNTIRLHLGALGQEVDVGTVSDTQGFVRHIEALSQLTGLPVQHAIYDSHG